MEKSALGRVLDARDLDAAGGPRARLAIDVPAAWIEEGVELVVRTPRLLGCARCDGGGCDACERSGALRAPSDPEARVVRVTVGPSSIDPERDGSRAIVVRVAQPFGPDEEIDQLLLELRPSASASPSVTRVARATVPASASGGLLREHLALPALLATAAALAAILIELLRR